MSQFMSWHLLQWKGSIEIFKKLLVKCNSIQVRIKEDTLDMNLFYKYWNIILFYLASIKKRSNKVGEGLGKYKEWESSTYFIVKGWKGSCGRGGVSASWNINIAHAHVHDLNTCYNIIEPLAQDLRGSWGGGPYGDLTDRLFFLYVLCKKSTKYVIYIYIYIYIYI